MLPRSREAKDEGNFHSYGQFLPVGRPRTLASARVSGLLPIQRADAQEESVWHGMCYRTLQPKRAISSLRGHHGKESIEAGQEAKLRKDSE